MLESTPKWVFLGLFRAILALFSPILAKSTEYAYFCIKCVRKTLMGGPQRKAVLLFLWAKTAGNLYWRALASLGKRYYHKGEAPYACILSYA